MKKVIVLLLGLMGWGFAVKAQCPKWIVASSQLSSSNVWTAWGTGNLNFYEVDMRNPTLSTTQRVLSPQITNKMSFGNGQLLQTQCNKNGDVAFYVFIQSPEPLVGNVYSADTLTVVQFNPITHQDEIIGAIAPIWFGRQIQEINTVLVPTKTDEYYLIFKTSVVSAYLDDIEYVKVNTTSRTVSPPQVIISSKHNNEGMAVSQLATCLNRWLFTVEDDGTGNKLYVMRSLISSTGITSPTKVDSIIIIPNTTGGQGEIEISPNSQYLAVVNFTTTPSTTTKDLIIFDFNLSTGITSNQRSIDNPTNPFLACEFSPNSQRIYILQAGTSAYPNREIYGLNIPVSNYTIASSDLEPGLNAVILWGGQSLESGYNGKIYVNYGLGSTAFLEIPNPNGPNAPLVPTQPNTFGAGVEIGGAIPDQIDGEKIIQPKKLILTNDTGFCGSFSLVIKSTDSNTVWSTGVTDSQIIVSTNGTYSAMLFDAYFCDTLRDTIYVSQGVAPNFSLGNDSSFCTSFSKTLSTGIGTTHWSTGVVASQITVNTAGTYWASDTNSCGNKSDTIVLSIITPPNFSLGNDTSFCVGQSVTLSTSISPATYLWSNGLTTSSISANTMGLYWLMVTANGCSNTDSINLTTKTIPSSFSLGNDTTICSNSKLQLIASDTNTIWSTGFVGKQITVNEPGVYWAAVSNNCGTFRDTVTVTLNNSSCTLAIPNAFTPNADGNNDVFVPIAKCDLSDYLFRIYNRWGERVFETTDIKQGWDGKYHNLYQPFGTFVYYISYHDDCSQEEKFIKGNMMLIK